ncbi:hypothetical protein MC885_013395 [Smutsia gigantea]|nr:hypothetical protein MC885_013395 [Smutsia gigantea]
MNKAFKLHLPAACPRACFQTKGSVEVRASPEAMPGLMEKEETQSFHSGAGASWWGGQGQPPQVRKRAPAPVPGPSPGSPNSTKVVISPSLVSTFLSTFHQKPKVYQGVRVKITVKELLQQRRAHQAASGATLSGGNSVHLADPVTPSSAGLYFEPEPISSTPNYFQPREFSSCVSREENPSCLNQIFDSYLQTETHPGPSLNSLQNMPHCFPDSFQAAPFCFNQNLTQGSPSDSSTLSGSLDYSYSPAQLPACAPENYNLLSSLETRNRGYPLEDCSYPHVPSHAPYDCFSSASASVCYCASCEAEHLDTIRASEYFSYPSMDYVNFAPSAVTTSDFYKRETNCDPAWSYAGSLGLLSLPDMVHPGVQRGPCVKRWLQPTPITA